MNKAIVTKSITYVTSFLKKLLLLGQKITSILEKLWSNLIARSIIGAIVFIAAAIIPIINYFDDHPPQVSELKCEGLSENSAIEVGRPLFSWTFKDEDQGGRQDSVYIRVGIKAGDVSMWNHRFAGSQNQILYAGKVLKNNRTYHWYIEVVDNDGLHSQSQYSTFETKWQEQPIREIVTIQNRDTMDVYILNQYLESISELARTFRDAHHGATCQYSLEFSKVKTDLFQLKIVFQSLTTASALTFNDIVFVQNAEHALWRLLERAYKHLRSQLENYYHKGGAPEGSQQ